MPRVASGVERGSEEDVVAKVVRAKAFQEAGQEIRFFRLRPESLGTLFSVVARRIDFLAGILDVAAQLGTFLRRQALRPWMHPSGMRPSPLIARLPPNVFLPAFLVPGSGVFPRVGLDRRRGHHEKKHQGKTARHPFARIHRRHLLSAAPR